MLMVRSLACFLIRTFSCSCSFISLFSFHVSGCFCFHNSNYVAFVKNKLFCKCLRITFHLQYNYVWNMYLWMDFWQSLGKSPLMKICRHVFFFNAQRNGVDLACFVTTNLTNHSSLFQANVACFWCHSHSFESSKSYWPVHLGFKLEHSC